MSLPSRECGLKSPDVLDRVAAYNVTPLAGVWIEIALALAGLALLRVTPLAGVWIEIISLTWNRPTNSVTPLAGVWIEIGSRQLQLSFVRVTPLAGVWIEMVLMIGGWLGIRGHSPRGSVD